MKKLLCLAALITLLGCQQEQTKTAEQQQPSESKSEQQPSQTKAEKESVEKTELIAAEQLSVQAKAELKQRLKQELEQNMWQQGKVVYLTMEGGFYGIVTKDGRKLLPMNLPKELRQHDAVIEFTGKIVKDMATIQQWGTPFKLVDTKLIKAGGYHPSEL